MSATEAFQELLAVHAAAVNDPRRISRWPWVRSRAERDVNDLADALTQWMTRRELQLIDEAVERAQKDLANNPEIPRWRAPLIRDVKSQLDILGNLFSAPDNMIAERVFRENIFEMDNLQTREAEISASRIPRNLYEDAIALADFATRPHRELFRHPTPRARKLAEFITSGMCVAEQPITVWRGEHPSERAPDFARSTLSARVGDTIHRTATPLSTSLDPGIAARSDFSGASAIGADQLSNGWILKIATNELLYTGSREVLTCMSDGLANEEKEALIVAPALRVTGIFEGAIHANWGLKRARIIECIPLR